MLFIKIDVDLLLCDQYYYHIIPCINFYNEGLNYFHLCGVPIKISRILYVLVFLLHSLQFREWKLGDGNPLNP